MQSWARHQIGNMMFEEATRQKLTCSTTKCRVRSASNITACFKEAESDADFQKMWEVTFGTFDRQKGWAKKLANTFMSLKGWEYILDTKPEKTRTGCVERQISKIKVELIKCLNTAAKLTHGKKVGISRSPEQITEGNKFEKRTKAVFKAQYIVSRVSTILILSLFVDT